MNILFKKWLRFDLIMVYKILFNMVDVSAPQIFTWASSSNYARRHCHKLVFNFSRVDVRTYFFSEPFVKQWNDLAAQPQDFVYLGLFINVLDRTDMCKLLLLWR